MRLIINGYDIDIYANDAVKGISQTKQANDLNDIASRQANYTNRFSVPKSAKNLLAFQNLTLTGNQSNIPYQKNECYLFGNSGECFVWKGWATIRDGGNDFEVQIVDGIIDLYKAIENQNLTALGLSELDHIKNIENVKATWVSGNTLPYRYILADYNGKTGDTAAGEVNIDYIVPSVKISYLWDKIFSTYGFTYSGSVFQTQAFKNLWMTYPKGITQADLDVLIFESIDYEFLYSGYRAYARFLSTETNILPATPSNIHMKVGATGEYRIRITGGLNIVSNFGSLKRSVVGIGKNCEGIAVPFVTPIYTQEFAYDEYMDISYTVTLNENESLCVFVGPVTSGSWFVQDTTDLQVYLYKIDNPFNVSRAFSDFSIRDFMTEIVHRFGLTIYNSKSTPSHYEFLTLQEVLQNTEFDDWSEKFITKNAETFTYRNYAQRNYFRYKYNDEESTHNDGYIDINNVNLQDSYDVIKSKIYSPDKETALYLGRQSNVYRLWSKEPNTGSDADVEPYIFKSLDKRYYFIRTLRINGTIDIVSETAGTSDTATGYDFESYYKLGFSDIITDYYSQMRQILNKVIMPSIELWLTESDVANLDFKKLKYFRQLGNYYILNKLTYVEGAKAKGEFTRVEYSPYVPVQVIEIVTISGAGGVITLGFTTTLTTPTLIFQYQQLGSSTWVNVSGGLTSPKIITGVTPGVVYLVRIYDPANDVYSTTTRDVLITG